MPRDDLPGSLKFPTKNWRLVCLAIAGALGGSVWALLTDQSCQACRAAHDLFGGTNVAPVGIIFYAALLATMLWKGANGWTLRGIFAAAGVHLILVAVLAARHLVCPPCLTTALAAFLAAGIVVAGAKPKPSVFMVLPLAAALMLGAVVLNQRVQAREQERAVRGLIAELEQEPRMGGSAQNATVRLVIYERPNCHFCAELENKVLPAALARFQNEAGGRVEVERRTARTDTLPTPTLIFIGGREESWLIGLPQEEQLLSALRRAR